jgi:ATP-binding cassette subfamily F protein 3
VILISHDRHLLDACAEQLWLVANGTVAPFAGDLEDYRRRVLAGEDAERKNGAPSLSRGPSRSDQRRSAAEKRAELAPLNPTCAVGGYFLRFRARRCESDQRVG